jgi:hypothetical protein
MRQDSRYQSKTDMITRRIFELGAILALHLAEVAG